MAEAQKVQQALLKGTQWAETAKEQGIEARKDIPNGKLLLKDRSPTDKNIEKLLVSFLSQNEGRMVHVLVFFGPGAVVPRQFPDLLPGDEKIMPFYYLKPQNAEALAEILEHAAAGMNELRKKTTEKAAEQREKAKLLQ